MRSKNALLLDDSISRRTNHVEQQQFDESDAISDEIAFNLVSRTLNCKDPEQYAEEIQVCSYSYPTTKYEI